VWHGRYAQELGVVVKVGAYMEAVFLFLFKILYVHRWQPMSGGVPSGRAGCMFLIRYNHSMSFFFVFFFFFRFSFFLVSPAFVLYLSLRCFCFDSLLLRQGGVFFFFFFFCFFVGVVCKVDY
jgi:hypothetical protein